jgi:hypothetical protein
MSVTAAERSREYLSLPYGSPRTVLAKSGHAYEKSSRNDYLRLSVTPILTFKHDEK